MKFNKILIALALCAAMQPNVSFGSQRSQNESYWQRTKNYVARAKNYAASWVPGSVKNVSAVAADRMDDFFQPSVIRQFKRAVRSSFGIDRKLYEVAVSGIDKADIRGVYASFDKRRLDKVVAQAIGGIFESPDKISLIKSLARDKHKEEENLRKIYAQAIKEGFSENYLAMIKFHLRGLYFLNDDEFLVIEYIVMNPNMRGHFL